MYIIITKLVTTITLVFILLAPNVWAAEYTELESSLARINPDMKAVNIEATPMFGIYNVLLNTGKLILKSDSAIYNELNKTITLVGAPSSIDSTEGSRVFKGSANKIIFFSNSKVQLVGRAIMNYDNIDISSNSIVFNPENGKMTSNE